MKDTCCCLVKIKMELCEVYKFVLQHRYNDDRLLLKIVTLAINVQDELNLLDQALVYKKWNVINMLIKNGVNANSLFEYCMENAFDYTAMKNGTDELFNNVFLNNSSLDVDKAKEILENYNWHFSVFENRNVISFKMKKRDSLELLLALENYNMNKVDDILNTRLVHHQ